MAAPTFIQEAETTWTANAVSNLTTGSFSVLTGDVLAAFAVGEHDGTDHLPFTIAGGSLTWTKRQEVGAASNGSWCYVIIWTATVDTNKSMTVTFSRSIVNLDTYSWGGNVFTFRGSTGVGASAKNNVASAAPTVTLTTTADNSAIVVANADWNSVDGTSRAWRVSAGTFAEQTYYHDGAAYTTYGGYHANAGAIASPAVGLSSPGGQKYAIVAVEIKGSGGALQALAGSTAGGSTVSATLNVAWILAAGTAATATVSATLSVPAAQALAGSVAAVATVSATLTTNIKVLAGASNATGGAGATTLITIVAPPVAFRPPTVDEVPAVLLSTHGVQRRLFRYYGPNPRGQAVVLVAGHYTTIPNPTTDQLEAAGNIEGVGFFLGGHVYPRLSAAVSAALIADGYGAYVS